MRPWLLLNVIVLCKFVLLAPAMVQPRLVMSPNATSETSQGNMPAEHFSGIGRAGNLFTARKFREAAVLYSQLTKEDPTNGDLWIREGRAYQNAGDLQKAIEAYSKGTELGFGTAYISINVAALYAALKNEELALEWIERALKERLDGRTGLLNDPAFASLKGNPRFRKLTAALPEARMGRVDGWRFDLDLLVAEAKRLHASPDRDAFSTAFTESAQRLRVSIASTSNAELELGIQRLVVMLNDGHSNALSAKAPNLLQLQVDLYEFSDGIFVLDGEGDAKTVIGDKVLKIGGKPIDWLADQIRAYQPHDNAMMYKWTRPLYLTDPDLLRHFGALSNDTEASITVQDAIGHIVDVRIPITTNWHQAKLFPSLIGTSPAPLYLRNVKENFWYEYLPEHGALYLQVNQLWRTPSMTVEELADRVSAELATKKSRNLIIDVRHDNGGNGYLSRALVKAVAAFEQSSKENRVFVIVGRGTFSAGQILITLMERFTNAIFVGEPSSSRPNFTGEDGERLLLPYSGMKVNISYKYHQNSAFDDQRQWIPVAIPVELDSRRYFRNEDPALAAVFGLIGQE